MFRKGKKTILLLVVLEHCKIFSEKSSTVPNHWILHTDKKENKILLIYKEIQNGEVAKSYVTSGLLMYGEIFAHFLIY